MVRSRSAVQIRSRAPVVSLVNFLANSPMDHHAIIAVIGLPGSGKTEVIRYLEKKGLPKVYFGAIVLDEVTRRGLEVTEKNERAVREELRARHGMAAMAKLSLSDIRAFVRSHHVLIESLYSWEEYLLLREAFGKFFRVIAVHAVPEIRYQRLALRAVRPLTPTEAWSRDTSQIENLHQAGPIAMADQMLVNEGDLEKLNQAVEVAYQEIVHSTRSV